MKKLLPILFILLATVAARADLVTATIVITNAPTVNGATLTVNGNTRTWTNNVVNAATQIGTNATIGGSATNMFNQIAGSPFAGVSLARSSTNGVVLAGLNMTATVSAGYATVTLVTNTTSSIRNVEVPFSSAYSATGRVGIASLLITGLENTTTAFETNSPALTNHFGRFTDQTISGSNWFTGANMLSNTSQFITGGGISNMALTNITYFQGSNGVVWALILVNPVLTNGLNYGSAFRSPGSGLDSEQFGNTATATGDGSLAAGAVATASAANTVALGTSAAASGGKAIAIGNSSVSQGLGSISIGDAAESDVEGAIAIGKDALSIYTNSISIGPNSAATAAYQISLGTPLYSVSIPGNLQVDGSISNATFAGSVTLNNELILTSFANSSLANGNNAAISISTNAYVTIASGPSALFTINGIAGGVAGRVVTLENTTGQSMVIASESGVDPTAANRIKTGLTADYTITNNPGVVSFRYNGTLSRWVLLSHN